MHPFLSHPGPIPIVHRGAPLTQSESIVENTLAAFTRAYERGFRYFETDVHATRDGVAVACHDENLRRVAGQRVRVADVDLEDLTKVSVGGQPLPQLTELLDAFPDVYFNLDPKADSAVRPLVDELRSRDILMRVCVASFSDRRLRWVRAALGPRVCTAAGPREIRTALGQVARRVPIDLNGPDVLQIPRLLARARRDGRVRRRLDLLSAAERVGLPVHVWTVNDEGEMADLLASGVDGVMSDDVEVLERVFGANGWQPTS